MKASLLYKGYSIDLSDEVDGDNQASYQIIDSPDPDDVQQEPVQVECQNWQNLEKIAQREVDRLILSKP